MTRFKRTVEHFRIERIRFKGLVRFYVFDLVGKCEVRELSDYAAEFSTHSVLTIEKLLYHLIRVYEYCRQTGIELNQINVSRLKNYRKWEYECTIKDKSHRGKKANAEFTVNTKLDALLTWLIWMKATNRLTLPQLMLPAHGQARGKEPLALRKRFSTVYFQGTGAKSKHKVTMVPTEEKRDEIFDIVKSMTENDYVTERNVLLAKLVQRSGMRIGSAVSLLVSQFPASLDESRSTSAHGVIPPVQKFGRAHEYPIPIETALEVRRFIKERLGPFLKTKNTGKDLSEGRIFVSARDGRPMRARSLSAVFGRVMREAGLPKGNAVHILRKVFATDEAEANIRRRIQVGADLSAEAILADAALSLNQSNVASSRPYVLRGSNVAMEKVAQFEAEENSRLREKNSQQRDEIRKLRALVAAMRSRA